MNFLVITHICGEPLKCVGGGETGSPCSAEHVRTFLNPALTLTTISHHIQLLAILTFQRKHVGAHARRVDRR